MTYLSSVPGAKVGDNVRIHETVVLVCPENMEFGDNVRIDPYCVISASGGSLKLGGYNHIGAHCMIFAGAGVTIEEFAGLSGGVCIYSTSDDYSGRHLTNPTVPHEYLGNVRKPVTLGRHAIVGAQSVILPGCDVGKGSAVGALSLVTKKLEPWGVYAGNPARRLKDRKRDLLELEARLTRSQ